MQFLDTAFGVTRAVLLVGSYAIKVPNVANGWWCAISGLQGNHQERVFSGVDARYCPTIFSAWGGLLNVMRRAAPLTEAEWDAFNLDTFQIDGTHEVPVEEKRSSFGWLDGRIVAVDYGS